MNIGIDRCMSRHSDPVSSPGVTQNFESKRQWLRADQRGKVIEFHKDMIKKSSHALSQLSTGSVSFSQGARVDPELRVQAQKRSGAGSAADPTILDVLS